MLLRFRVENHRSLRDEQELSFVAASGIKDSAEALTHSEAYGLCVLPVIALYGANASGKSSVLDALRFLVTAVRESHRLWDPAGPIPLDHFSFELDSFFTPSLFEVDLLISDVRYQYGFTANETFIEKEWLFAYPHGKRQAWFQRSSGDFRFSRSLQGENGIIKGLTRGNSLFLSAAAQNNHEMLRPIYDWFFRQFEFVDDKTRDATGTTTIAAYRDPKLRSAIHDLITRADLGITGIDVVEMSPDRKNIFREAFLKTHPEQLEKLKEAAKSTEIVFQHRSSEGYANVPFERESRGTQMLFSLAGQIVRALSSGSTLCIDEIDSSLHPLLALEIIRFFQDPERNRLRAQLIFTTHDTNILDSELLRRDQIWFTEKDDAGATHLYPLTDFRPRKHENIKRGYLQGRYGAVPFLTTADSFSVPDADADGE